MRILHGLIFLLIFGVVFCKESEDDGDTAAAFIEAAKSLFADNKDTLGGLRGAASAFAQSDSGKQMMGDMLSSGNRKNGDVVGQILSGVGSLLSGQNGQGGRTGAGGIDLSMLGMLVDTFASATNGGDNKRPRSSDHDDSNEVEGGMDFDSLLGIASTIFGGSNNNAGNLAGLLPTLLEGFTSRGHKHSSDHASHSWYMPPIIENMHVLWEHFVNSELGQTLWKNSGLAKIVGSMTDSDGHIKYDQIMESFENAALRRRWIKSMTNFVAEWVSHVSDPATRQRYLTTFQFIGNSFLKSQGYHKSVMFDPLKPTESIIRLVNAVAKRHLSLGIDSSTYIKPAVAYVQELVNLASEKGFIMSRINARELSSRLSETINDDVIGPLLKVYRAYKWSLKAPECGTQILCVINTKNEEEVQGKRGAALRFALIRMASYPAAWSISNKASANFWTLFGSIQETGNCYNKYPGECNEFFEEEHRVSNEIVHNEL